LSNRPGKEELPTPSHGQCSAKGLPIEGSFSFLDYSWRITLRRDIVDVEPAIGVNEAQFLKFVHEKIYS
jgi:hypothetical protein